MQTYRRVLRPFDKNSGQASSAQAFDTAPPIHAFYHEIYNGAYTSTSLSTSTSTPLSTSTSTLRLRSGQASSAQAQRPAVL